MKKLIRLLTVWLFAMGTLAQASKVDYVAVATPGGFQAATFTGGGPSNQFPRMKGTYNGLALPIGSFVPQYSGFFTFNINSDRYFDGSMNIGDYRYPLGGRFDQQGNAGVTVYKRVWDDCGCYYYLVLVWVVDLRLVPGTDEVVGNADNVRHGWRTTLSGYRAYGSPDYPAPQQGRYTLRLPSNADPAIAPAGEGYGVVTVNSKGRVEAYGALPDGTAYSRSAGISTNGWWPFYFPFNGGRGALIGWLNFNVAPGSDVAGELTLAKPRDDSRKLYPEGYIGTVAASGSRYTAPSSSTLALSWTNGIFRLFGGELAVPATNDIALLPGGKLVNEGGSITNLKFSLSRGTGKFTGKFTHPVSGKSTSYAGILDQGQDIGAGYFLAPTQGGLIRLEPDP